MKEGKKSEGKREKEDEFLLLRLAKHGKILQPFYIINSYYILVQTAREIKIGQASTSSSGDVVKRGCDT